ncbi:MAG: rhodanese-like domain-containing protein [Acidimicrobiia bacterium]
MVTNIDRALLLDLIEGGAQVVDVLPEREYSAQHLPDAINIPLRRLDLEATAALRRDKPVVVY